MKKYILICILMLGSGVLCARAASKWNNWSDKETLLANLNRAADKGRTYFSMFKFYDYTRTDDINDSRAKYLDHPFMYGIDFYQATGDYLPKEMTSAQYHNIAVMVKAAWKNNRAVPLVSWHLHSPYAVYSEFQNKMGCRYHHLVEGYPQNHRYVVNEILNNKQIDTLGIGNIGDWFDLQVREIADFINKEFVDENGKPIPFVFRLWHEQQDSWQWWGLGTGSSKRTHVSVEDYKALWRLTVEKFRNYCPNAQILWCYCPDRYFSDEASYLESYPGDDVVDILAYDDYQIGDDRGCTAQMFIDAILNRARVVSAVSSRLSKPAMIAESNCKTADMKDEYYDYVEYVLTDKKVHISVFQLWSMSFYKQQTIKFIDQKNIIWSL